MNQQQAKYTPREIPKQFRHTEIPCFNCRTPVKVHLNADGTYVGCVFCYNCRVGYSAGTEQFSKTREF